MPKVKFPGPCPQCGKIQEYYKKELCDNCYKKAKRRKRGLKPTAIRTQLGPCRVCGSTTSSTGRFVRGMCHACYKRIVLRGSNKIPRTKFSGPCNECGKTDPSVGYSKRLCPTCYQRKERDQYRFSLFRFRAKQAGVESNLTDEQWKRVLIHFKYRCAYCGKDIFLEYTMDHVIPMSKGGPHTINNVVPCCLSCNSKKKDGPPLRPVITLKE